MVSDNQFIYGVFQEELKNRFLCRVSVNGMDTICYVPSSCRLSNFFKMPGKTVMLKRVLSSKAKTQFSIYAVKVKNHFIPVNLAEANRIVENNIKQRKFSFLGRRDEIHREELISGYKTDLYITDTCTVVEIKSILSLEKTAVFPTVFSERAIKQLQELTRLLQEGYKICYMFVSMNSSVERIVINRQDNTYYSMMSQLVKLGLQCVALSFKMKDGEIIINRRIPICFE